MKNAEKALAAQRKHWVTRHNKLNSMRPNNMTLVELRLFTIYLSRINPFDESTRLVRLALSDFQRIFELKQVKPVEILRITEKLLGKTVMVPLDCGGFDVFQIFKRFRLSNTSPLWEQAEECDLVSFGSADGGGAALGADTAVVFAHPDDEKVFYERMERMCRGGEWYVEMDAHDDALPLMFNLKAHYFKYQLWNAVRLKSVNQLRMYEILKQYENLGERILHVEELKVYLGIGKDEYANYNDFKIKVLNVCQKALAEHTDITFTYEPYGKKGRGGKIFQLKFTIMKNKGHADPLAIGKFIDLDERAGSPASAAASLTVSENLPGLPEKEVEGKNEPLKDVSQFPQPVPGLNANEDFENLWSRFLKKEGKRKAREIYEAAINNGVESGDIIAGLDAYNAYVVGQEIEARYIKSPKGWLEERYWENDYGSAPAKKRQTNAFHNFKQGKYDWVAHEKLERDRQMKEQGLGPLLSEEERKGLLERALKK